MYVSDPSEVPDQYEVQEGQGGGLYYETDGPGADQDRETVGDEATEEQLGEMRDNISQRVEEQEMELREMGEDMVYEMIEEDPEQGVDAVNERVREEMEDRVLDEVQSEHGVELEGHTFDEAREAVAEAIDPIFEDVQATEEDLNIQEQNIPTDPAGP